MSIVMQFPAGVGFYTNRNGVKVEPDALGQVSIDSVDLIEYFAAGFYPAGMIADEITQDADITALETAVTPAGVGTMISGATAKNAPADADMIGLMDSAASNVLKKLSWAYVKSVLKTYFDALYTLANLGGVAHSLATAANDFLVASGSGAFIKKTLAETKAIIGIPLYDKALSGDLIFVIDPATVNRAATAAAWARTVTVTLKTAAAEVHTWFNRAIATGVSIADTSLAGTATIVSTTLTFINGVATVEVSGDAAAWLAADTDTLTIADATILGSTVAGGTSVQTFTA